MNEKPKKTYRRKVEVECEACKWREGEIGYPSPCPKHETPATEPTVGRKMNVGKIMEDSMAYWDDRVAKARVKLAEAIGESASRRHAADLAIPILTNEMNEARIYFLDVGYLMGRGSAARDVDTMASNVALGRPWYYLPIQKLRREMFDAGMIERRPFTGDGISRLLSAAAITFSAMAVAMTPVAIYGIYKIIFSQ